MSAAGELPHHADLTGRMALFGKLFAEKEGLLDPARVPSPQDLVALVRMHVPRSTTPAETPIFEAAAYMGEWMRVQGGAEWVAEGPFEPHLQMHDATGAIIVLVPLVSVLRTACTAGYDGLPALLQEVLDDVRHPAQTTPLAEIRVRPDDDRIRLVAWVLATRDRVARGRVAVASLWRRCASCARKLEEAVELPAPWMGWEAQAGIAASLLSQRDFCCPCGGSAGEASRLVMLRFDPVGDAIRLGDIHVTPRHTRVACWTLDGDDVVPFDARQLADEGPMG
ncbi:MAG TPA: hypothetical protein VHH36_06930 [Candidatus Thermoplasmatota archaeon]|nr:hypothetical protein [Candidatus Thermoplasmatota archaeon]